MKEIFSTYPVIAWALVSIVAAGFIIMLMWQQMRWWWHNTWYSFPIIGRISRLAGDSNTANEPGWFKSERALCRDYKKFIRIQDENDFNEKINYLTKAGDLGRKETPNWIWLLTICMVFIEAMGFAYVLAGFTVPGASENTQQYGALGIAFLISVILVAFTHLAGHELFKSSQIAHSRREWIEDDKQHKLSTGTVALAKPQSVDDKQPIYAQLANRVGTHPSYKITGATVAFVAIVAIFATYVRGTVLEQQLLLETTGKAAEASLSLSVDNDSLDFSMPSDATQFPVADVAEQNKAEQKAVIEGSNNQRHGGWGTFIVLAFVFVFLQILGVIFGFRWGFAGLESSAAHRSIGQGKYSSYADVREHYQEIADTAQAQLDNLQQRLMASNSRTGTSGKQSKKTFRDFMEEERSLVHASNLARVEPAATVISQELNENSPSTEINDILIKIDSLADKKAKKDFIAALPDNLITPVQDALMSRKVLSARSKIDDLIDE